MTPARLYRSRLDAAVQSSVALLGVIRCSLNPFLLGHGLRRCLKNLPTSEIEVSSVSCEQICVDYFFSNNVWFFLSHHVILNLIQDLTFIFSKRILILFFITLCHPELVLGSLFTFFFKIVFESFFLSLLYFYIFIKITTTSSKGKKLARSPKPAVSCEDFFFTRWDLFWCDSGSPLPISPRRSGAKLGRFAWGNPLLLGHGLGRYTKNSPPSQK